MSDPDLSPIVRTRHLHCEPEHAFEVFTRRLGDWWPLRGLAGAARELAQVTVECRLGGRVLERGADGTEHAWGEITRWSPPQGLTIDVQPSDGNAPTAVEVAFERHENGTRVTLTHRGWERLAGDARAQRAHHEATWPRVLARFADAAADPACSESYARMTNQLVWALLEGGPRTAEDDARMLDAAHASAFHWARVGGQIEAARAQWLLSRVYAVLGVANRAGHHAARSAALCREGEVEDFDLAYAEEALARAAAASGDMAEATRRWSLARALGERIADEEDRAIFTGDLASEPWFGLEPPASAG